MTNYFEEYGLVKSGSQSATVEAMLEIQPNLESTNYPYASAYVKQMWDKVEKSGKISRDMRGATFEFIISCVLIKEKILPFYTQAQVAFVPLANFDILIYTKELGPVIMSAKTSLRERYKQTEFESQALKQIYRKSRTYLITLDQNEAASVNSKIQDGSLFAINKVLCADSKEFDNLINEIKSLTPIESPQVQIVENGRRVDRRTSRI